MKMNSRDLETLAGLNNIRQLHDSKNDSLMARFFKENPPMSVNLGDPFDHGHKTPRAMLGGCPVFGETGPTIEPSTSLMEFAKRCESGDDYALAEIERASITRNPTFFPRFEGPLYGPYGEINHPPLMEAEQARGITIRPRLPGRATIERSVLFFPRQTGKSVAMHKSIESFSRAQQANLPTGAVRYLSCCKPYFYGNFYFGER